MPNQASTDTTAVVHPDTPEGRIRLRHRRWLSWLTFAVLAAVMAGAVLDELGVTQVWGVEAASVSDVAADGTRLTVRYPAVSRPALASPFEIVVTSPGGFADDVEIAVDVGYLAAWDLNGIYPVPAAERSAGDRVVWTFDRPDGDVLRVLYDARIEPGVQLERRRGSVALVDGDRSLAMVRFTTSVRP